MTPAEYEARLHAALDARRDPLDDPQLRAFLDEHPGRLEAFADLRARLAVLPALGVPARRARRRRAPWLLVAAAAAAAWILWPAAPAAAAAQPGRVLAGALAPIRPTLAAAGTARARTVLLDRPGMRLEVFTQWSTR
jgi:hypothetical protein